MIITLSPAKTLDYKSPVSITESTIPTYQKEAKEINDLLKPLSVEDIAELMSVNASIAHEVYHYIHSYDMKKTEDRQAIFAYHGIAYLGLDAATLTKDDLEFAQKHLVLLSGLYGILRPLDRIKPYRLEMQINLANKKGKNLYDYWSDTISQYVAKQMKNDDNVWINLSSQEYTKVINRKLLPKGHQIITPIFKEARGSEYKQIVVYAKKARGMMTRFIIQNRLTDVEHLKGFDTDGYAYSPQLSNEKEWVFVRLSSKS